MCLKTNSSYLDCPIAAKLKGSEQIEMLVAVHNPSSLELSEAEILVPQGSYAVFAHRKETEWEAVHFDLNCFVDDLWKSFTNCKLRVRSTVPSL